MTQDDVVEISRPISNIRIFSLSSLLVERFFESIRKSLGHFQSILKRKRIRKLHYQSACRSSFKVKRRYRSSTFNIPLTFISYKKRIVGFFLESIHNRCRTIIRLTQSTKKRNHELVTQRLSRPSSGSLNNPTI